MIAKTAEEGVSTVTLFEDLQSVVAPQADSHRGLVLGIIWTVETAAEVRHLVKAQSSLQFAHFVMSRR